MKFRNENNSMDPMGLGYQLGLILDPLPSKICLLVYEFGLRQAPDFKYSKPSDDIIETGPPQMMPLFLTL